MAQSIADWWYFGSRAGIHFGPNGVEVVNDGQLIALEGCASISDPVGNLQFYSEGTEVYDRTHNLMPNGTGLLGNFSTTQGAFILQRPGHSNRYFLFTLDDSFGPDGLRYSEVDMTLNGGLGDVLASNKNTLLTDSLTEKMTVVGHANGLDFWLLVHDWGNNHFLAYHISSSGVHPNPVVSAVGTNHPSHPNDASVERHCAGVMKFSPNGKRLAVARPRSTNIFELFDFNRNTGVVSNPMEIGTGVLRWSTFTLEFSPDGNLLYCNGSSNPGAGVLSQYNLLAGSATDIANSVEVINITQLCTGLQLGPDHDLYIAHEGTSFLSVLKDPNEIGAACNPRQNAFNLSPGGCHSGLPQFATNQFYTAFEVDGDCQGDSIMFNLTLPRVDSVFWDFEDPGSMDDGISQAVSPIHVFNRPGLYTVQVVVWINYKPESYTQTIRIYPKPELDLGMDTVLCDADSFTIRAQTGLGEYDYLWQNGSLTDSLRVDSAGLYILNVTNSCGTASDSLWVDFRPSVPRFELGADTILCPDSLLELAPALGVGTYRWSDGSEGESLTVDAQGMYALTVDNECGLWTDSIFVGHDPNSCPPVLEECVRVPNVFTPNGDGRNDVLKVSADCAVYDLHLAVFNRWGEPVFETSGDQVEWDGTNQRNQVVSEGAYFYTLDFRTEEYGEDQIGRVAGAIQVLR